MADIREASSIVFLLLAGLSHNKPSAIRVMRSSRQAGFARFLVPCYLLWVFISTNKHIVLLMGSGETQIKTNNIMKIKVLVAAVAVALTATSCMTTSQSKSTQARIAQANAEIVVINPSAKVDVDPIRVNDVWVYQGSALENFKTGLASKIEEQLKIDATNKTLKKHSGDILVAPLIDVESVAENGKVKSYTVSVYGYIGKFVDWDKNGIELPAPEVAPTGEPVERVRVSVSTLQ